MTAAEAWAEIQRIEEQYRPERERSLRRAPVIRRLLDAHPEIFRMDRLVVSREDYNALLDDQKLAPGEVMRLCGVPVEPRP